jgi:hypothetical protein
VWTLSNQHHRTSGRYTWRRARRGPQSQVLDEGMLSRVVGPVRSELQSGARRRSMLGLSHGRGRAGLRGGRDGRVWFVGARGRSFESAVATRAGQRVNIIDSFQKGRPVETRER